MNINELYTTLGGDLEAALSRLMKLPTLMKIIKMFPADTSMSDLEHAIEAKDIEKAFRAVHSLKGVALGLSLTRLSDAACKLTEIFRGRGEFIAGWEEAYQDLRKEYDATIAALSQLEDS